MGKSLKTELKMLTNRNQFQVMLLFGVTLSITAFLIDCLVWFSQSIEQVPPAYGTWMGTSLYSNIVTATLFMLMPLYASIAYSDMFYVNQKSGYNNFIFTRSSRKNNVTSNAIMVFISGFIIVFLPLLLNQILCLIAFPFENTTNLGIATYKAIQVHYNYPLGGLSYHYPYLYNLVYCFIPAFFGGAFATLTLGISFWVDKGRVALFVLPFLLYQISTFILETTGNQTYSVYSYLRGGGGLSNLSVEWIFYLFLTMIGISIVLIIFAPKERFGIEQNV